MDPMARLTEIVDILLAFELLALHDKNLLPIDKCKRSKLTIEMLEEARHLLKETF